MTPAKAPANHDDVYKTAKSQWVTNAEWSA